MIVAIAAALVPIPRAVVESVYSERMFPRLQRLLTGLSNVFPFALLDVLLVAGGLAVVWMVVRDVRSLRARPSFAVASGSVMRVLVLAAAAYLFFLLAWGFNYRRVPLEHKLQFDATRVSVQTAVLLARTAVERVNALHAAGHRRGWSATATIDSGLADAFGKARQELGLRAGTRLGRPKRTLLDLYFRRVGVAGMTNPYFLETLVATDLLPFERPAVIAHEWSHLAGIADEGDANFVAWLTCLRGTAAHQYSGWLSLYGDVANALPRSVLGDVAAMLADGPRADLQAVRDRLLRQVNPTVSAAGWRVYDQYLKANQVDEGTASYADVVRLVLGTAFADDWTPLLKR